MAYLDGIQLWTFNGIEAARRITSAMEWDEWFEEDTLTSIEPILDSPDRYVDTGGVTYSPLSVLFAFPDLDAREQFAGLRGTTAILARPGQQRLALLKKISRLASGHDGYRLLACTFEAL